MSRPPAPLGDDDHHTEALTHIDEFGQARMVDVTAKPVTRRIAVARCVVLTAADAPGVLERRRGGVDVIEAARFAGVQAAKQTASLIPLCHPLNLDRVTVQVEVESHVVAVSASTEIVRSHRRRDGGAHGVRDHRPRPPQGADGRGPGGIDRAADPLVQIRRSLRRLEAHGRQRGQRPPAEIRTEPADSNPRANPVHVRGAGAPDAIRSRPARPQIAFARRLASFFLWSRAKSSYSRRRYRQWDPKVSDDQEIRSPPRSRRPSPPEPWTPRGRRDVYGPDRDDGHRLRGQIQFAAEHPCQGFRSSRRALRRVVARPDATADRLPRFEKDDRVHREWVLGRVDCPGHRDQGRDATR